MKRLLRAAAVVLLFVLPPACTRDLEEPQLTNPFDPRNGQGLPVPDSIVVQVMSNAVQLCWSVPGGESVDEFALFRRRLDTSTPELETLLDTVSARCFTDLSARNGHVYGYRIAAGRDGQFGARSEMVEVRPGAFSLVIADGARKTPSRTVRLTLNAPGAQTVRLWEDSDVTTLPFAASLDWQLSSADAEKTLHGVFQFPGGSETLPITDSIRLDTQAVIDTVNFTGPDIRYPGDTVHFVLHAREPGGKASVEVIGLFAAQQLDDAGNGVYERDVPVPAGVTVSVARVTGQFTDDVGNRAPSLVAPRTLSVRDTPAPVRFVKPALLAAPPDAPAVTVRWTQSRATDFAAYEIFRSETPPVDSASVRAGSPIAVAATVMFTDSDVAEGRQYFYRIYVQTRDGAKIGSQDTLHVRVPNLRPPRPVVLEEADAVAETRLRLRWNRSTDRDFAAYRVYRSESAVVTPGDSLVQPITDMFQTYWEELDLEENTTYHYVVHVVDTANFSTPSNEIAATTANAAPDSVRLTAADIGSTAATLSWERSTARDFGFYRLYRAETPTVTTSSTLVFETSDAYSTYYRDTGLGVSTTYYYRIFVVDDAEQPLSTGSSPISFTTSS